MIRLAVRFTRFPRRIEFAASCCTCAVNIWTPGRTTRSAPWWFEFTAAASLRLVRGTRGRPVPSEDVEMNKQGAGLAAATAFLLIPLAGALRGGSQNLRFTSLDVPKAISTHVRGVDSEGTVVGFYIDQSKKSHGFLRSPQGELTFPIDYVNKSV